MIENKIHQKWEKLVVTKIIMLWILAIRYEIFDEILNCKFRDVLNPILTISKASSEPQRLSQSCFWPLSETVNGAVHKWSQICTIILSISRIILESISTFHDCNTLVKKTHQIKDEKAIEYVIKVLQYILWSTWLSLSDIFLCLIMILWK